MTDYAKKFSGRVEREKRYKVLEGAVHMWVFLMVYVDHEGCMPPRYDMNGFFDFTDWLRELCPEEIDGYPLADLYAVFDEVCAYYKGDRDKVKACDVRREAEHLVRTWQKMRDKRMEGFIIV